MPKSVPNQKPTTQPIIQPEIEATFIDIDKDTLRA